MTTIPRDVLVKGYNGLVHIKGRPSGEVFRFLKCTLLGYLLETPKTRKRIFSVGPLLYTKRNDPNPSLTCNRR